MYQLDDLNEPIQADAEPDTGSPKVEVLSPSYEEKLTQSQILIELVADCELFHTPDGESFVSVPVENHVENYRIRSKALRLLLVERFFEVSEKPPGTQGLNDALSLLEAKARFKGDEHQVFSRVARLGKDVFIDLCNKTWGAVEITPAGWAVVSKPPVKFIRARGMSPLPNPVSGRSIHDLRKFLNVGDDDWKLIVGFILGAFSPNGPYPIAVLQGEQGSGKSGVARILKAIIDPSTAPLRTVPRETRDLMIAAQNSRVLSYDNLSGLQPWLSDAFCRLATGGGFSTRELYSDSDEIIFDSQRPLILNGIDAICTRDDLRDRSLVLVLPTIQPGKRKSEKILFAEFEQAVPGILGAFINAVSCALRNFENVKLHELPRMADFARWVTAAEDSLGWDEGSFLKIYSKNQTAAIEIGLESDAVAQTIIALAKIENWQGTLTELLEVISLRSSEKTIKSRSWPKTPQALSNKLRRLAPALRQVGIDAEFTREGRGGKRVVSIRTKPEKTVSTVSTDTNERNPFKNNDIDADTTAGTADDPLFSSSASNPLKNKGADDADTADDDLRTYSDSDGVRI